MLRYGLVVRVVMWLNTLCQIQMICPMLPDPFWGQTMDCMDDMGNHATLISAKLNEETFIYFASTLFHIDN